MIKFNFRRKKVELRKAKYKSGRTGLLVTYADSDVIVGPITANLVNFNFPEDEFPIEVTDHKNHRDILNQLFQTGIFEDTGKRGINQKEDKTVKIEFWKLIEPETISSIREFPVKLKKAK